MDIQKSSSQTTLAILLGASDWPDSPDFHGSKAFANAMKGFKEYLLNQYQLGLSTENVLDLFNVNDGPHLIDRKIRSFLDQRSTEMKRAGNAARDLLVYFVGHGGFIGRNSDYYLAIRCTATENARLSGLPIEALASILTEKARYLRRLIILDCCYAAAAFTMFQAEGPAKVGIEQTYDAFEKNKRTIGRGTALFCSSGKKVVSQIAPDESCTMFSKALLQALSQGDPRQQNKQYLSLRDIADLTEEVIDTVLDGKAPRPEVHSPDQIEGDVANVPIFPNRKFLNIIPLLYPEHTSAVRSIAWSPDGQLLASASSDNTVQVWNITNEHSMLTYKEHSNTVWDVAWSPDGQLLASASGDGTVQVWNPRTGTRQKIITQAHDGIWMQDVAWSPDGKYLASGGGNLVQIWDAIDGHNIFTYQISTALTSLAWSPDSTRIAPAAVHGAVQIWEVTTGRPSMTFNGNFDAVWAFIAWSADGKYVASSGKDGIVQVWNTITGKHIFTYHGHSGPVYGVTWSPDGRYIASASKDQTVQVWKAETGDKELVHKHSGWVATAAWSPDGRYIASGGADAKVDIWQAP